MAGMITTFELKNESSVKFQKLKKKTPIFGVNSC